MLAETFQCSFSNK